jgi:hypothetical protein
MKHFCPIARLGVSKKRWPVPERKAGFLSICDSRELYPFAETSQEDSVGKGTTEVVPSKNRIFIVVKPQAAATQHIHN